MPSGGRRSSPTARGGTSRRRSLYFGTDPPAVGDEAREWARLGPEEVASFFKPHMGSPTYRLRFRGRDYDATELSAMVLRRLKEDAEARARRAGRAGRDHRPRLLRRPPAQGDHRGRSARRAGGRPDHQRADRRGAGLRAAAGGPGGNRPDLRPRRRDLRRDRRPDHARRGRRPGHRRRPRPRRQGLGRPDRHATSPRSSPPRPGSTRSTTPSLSTKS